MVPKIHQQSIISRLLLCSRTSMATKTTNFSFSTFFLSCSGVDGSKAGLDFLHHALLRFSCEELCQVRAWLGQELYHDFYCINVSLSGIISRNGLVRSGLPLVVVLRSI